MTEEIADSLSLLADDVLRWGGGDRDEFWMLVASGIDMAPASVRIAVWKGWLDRAVQPQTRLAA